MPRPLFQLQVVRAVAALAVVVYHAQGELRHRGLADPFPDLAVGAFGVDLFFVVSGFIMVFASERLFGRPGAALPFLLRRVIRIAPLYWIVTAAFTAIAVRLGQFPGHAQPSATHIVASYLFLPAPRPEDGGYFPVYSLGWTLNYEMFFYACFAAVLGLRRGLAVAALSAGLGGLVLLGRLASLPWPLFYWSNPIVLEFVFGLWLGHAHLAGWRLPRRLGYALALAALGTLPFAVPLIDPSGPWRGLAWGVPAAVLVAWALGTGTVGTGAMARAAARVGDASYSLYLVHSALFIAMFELIRRLADPHRIPPAAYAATLVLASTLAGLALFRFLERPLTRAFQAALARTAAPGPGRRERIPAAGASPPGMGGAG